MSDITYSIDQKNIPECFAEFKNIIVRTILFADECLLQRQNLDEATSPNNFKEKWSENGYDYEVRVHPADPKYKKDGNIYRVARRLQGVDENGQGNGWEFADDNDNWFKEKDLKTINPSFDQARSDTHIPQPEKK